jgi:ribosomal protein L12E/L44/L45/RPP1/RPP2
MRQETERKVGRRDLLKGVAVGTVVLAAAGAAAAQGKARPETKDERKKARYKETEHVKAFYRTNRY